MNRRNEVVRKDNRPKPENAFVCEEAPSKDYGAEENVMNMKRDAEEKPLPKQPLIGAEGDSRMMTREIQGAKLSKQIMDKKRKKKTKSKNKATNTRRHQ